MKHRKKNTRSIYVNQVKNEFTRKPITLARHSTRHHHEH